MREPVAVALGSNLGDRRENVRYGVRELERLLSNVRTSGIYHTEPREGVRGGPFLNAVVAGAPSPDGPSSPQELLRQLLYIEMGTGRSPVRGAGDARTLDLDLLLVGDRQIDEERLTLPHPGLTRRAFVLTPLAELLPGWSHPGSGLTVRELSERAGRSDLELVGRDVLA